MCLTKIFSRVLEVQSPILYGEIKNKTFDITNRDIYNRRIDSDSDKKEKKGGEFGLIDLRYRKISVKPVVSRYSKVIL
jgi:hypothetical protein